MRQFMTHYVSPLLLVVASLFIAWYGCFLCDSGRDFMWNLSLTRRSFLIETPLHDRTTSDHLLDRLYSISMDLPLFVLGYESDRVNMFEGMRQSGGRVTPFAGGVALHDYEDVKAILEDPNQIRQSSVIGSRKIEDGCMDPTNLLFMSTGKKHRELVAFLTKVVPVMSGRGDYVAPTTELLASKHTVKQDAFEESWYDIFSVRDQAQVEASIRGVIVANLWYQVFGEQLTAAGADMVQQYGMWGDWCFHYSNGYKKPATELLKVRLTLLDVAKKSPVGLKVIEQAISKLGNTAEEASEVLLQLVDWVLHSGALDQARFVRRTLERINDSPANYVPLWKHDPSAFLLESARKEPPVTSVSVTLDKPKTFDVAAGFRGAGFVQVTVQPGTPILAVLSSANRDPKVFGGESKSAAVAKMFDPSREQSQLDQILTPKGTMIGQKQAFGEALQLALSIQLINQRMPAPDAAAAERSSSRLNAIIRRIRASSLDTLSPMSNTPWNKEIPLALAVVCCLWQLFSLRRIKAERGGAGTVIQDKYCLYLIAMMFMSVGRYFGGESPAFFFLCNHAGLRIASAYAEMVLYMRRYLDTREPGSTQHKLYFSTKWNPIRKLYDVPAGTTKVLTFEFFFHMLFGLLETYVGQSFPFYNLMLGILIWSNGIGVLDCFLSLSQTPYEGGQKSGVAGFRQECAKGVAGMLAHGFFLIAPSVAPAPVPAFYNLVSYVGECFVSIRWSLIGCHGADALMSLGHDTFGMKKGEREPILEKHFRSVVKNLKKSKVIKHVLTEEVTSDTKEVRAWQCFHRLGSSKAFAAEDEFTKDDFTSVLKKLMPVVDDKTIDSLFKASDKNKDGKIAFSEFGETRFGKDFCSIISDQVWLAQHGANESSSRLITTLLVCLIAIACAYCLPGIHDGISGGELCFIKEDKVEFGTLCDDGAAALDKADKHTRSMYRVLKNLASPRDASNGGMVPGNTLYTASAETAKGSSVKIPTSVGKHKRMNLPYCQPTFDNSYPDSCQIPHSGEDTTTDCGTEWSVDRVKCATISTLMQFVSSGLFSVLATQALFPLTDTEADWDNTGAAAAILRAGSRTELKPLELYPWKEMESDEAITRFSFAGIAAHNTQRVKGEGEIVYKNEWAWMSNYELRPGFESYGVNVYFNGKGELIQMYWAEENRNLTRGDPDWDHVKWAYKVSVLTGVTVRDHLVGVHFMASNMLTMASDENLMPDHPLRSFGAIEINLGATKTLGLELGTAHRASALTWKGLADALGDSYKLNRFAKIMDLMPMTGMDQTVSEDANRTLQEELFPYGRDHEEFWKIFRKFVGAYVDVYYNSDVAVRDDSELGPFWDALHVQEPFSTFPRLTGKDELVDVVTTFIVYVTGIHNQVGNVADYLINPTYASAKIRAGMNSADIQATFQGMNIGLMTSQLTPRLLNDWKHLLLQDEHHAATSLIFDTLQSDLRDLSQTLDERNEKRRFPCNAFNPKTMVAAVSI